MTKPPAITTILLLWVDALANIYAVHAVQKVNFIMDVCLGRARVHALVSREIICAPRQRDCSH